MKKAQLICAILFLALASFAPAPKGYLEDKGSGLKVIFYEVKVGNIKVQLNEKPLKGNSVKTDDELYLYVQDVTGWRPKANGNVFPACEVTVTDIDGNVLMETENILAEAVGENGVSAADAAFLNSNITPSVKWKSGTYRWEVKFWDLNGPGVIISDMIVEKK